MQALAWLAPVRVEVKHPCYGPARMGKVIASSLMTKLRIVSLILECGHQVINFFLVLVSFHDVSFLYAVSFHHAHVGKNILYVCRICSNDCPIAK